MAESIDKAYTWAINTCNAPNVGYWSQNPQRNQKTINGITYYDCSSFINYAINAGGFVTPNYAPKYNAFTTYTMGAVLIGLGFTQYSTNSSFVWKPGDIGVSTEHTEMCYEGGTGSAIFMGAHTSSYPLDEQVSIWTKSTNSFPYCYRWKEGGAVYSSYSKYVVAAICGNWWTESNVNPGVWESLQVTSWDTLLHGYGLGQWTNYNDTHGRLYKLHEWLVSNNYDLDSMEGQLAYFLVEKYWTPKSGVSINTLDDFLNSKSTNLNELTKAFMLCWEGIDNGTLEQRQEQAKEIYEYISAHAQDTSIKTYIHSNEFLSVENIKKNSVMVYRLLGGSGGGGGEPGHDKRSDYNKMPVWMMIKYRVMR